MESSIRSDMQVVSDEPIVSDRLLWEIWQSMLRFNTLMAADELGLFDLLEKSPRDIETLSKDLDLEVRATLAITENMMASNIISRNDNGTYELTELSKTYLTSGSEYYWGNLFKANRKYPLTYDMFITALKTNRSTCYEKEPLFEFIENDEQNARDVSYSLLDRSKYSAKKLETSDLFSGVKHLLDVGGGLGHLAASIVHGNAGMTATVMELPTVCKLGREYLEKEWPQHGVASRISFEPLDFFKDPWPVNADGMFFSDIFHDWSFSTCQEIADKAYKHLQDGGKIFVFEFLKDDDRCEPWLVQSYNMAMMLYTEGQQFRFSELEDILRKAGFKEITRHPMGDIYTLISATKNEPEFKAGLPEQQETIP